MTMKLVDCGLALACAQPVYAQLAPHNASGVTFGHVHLSVADPKVHHQMWVDQFGGVVSTKGTFTVVKLPNMMIAFRGTKPTGGTENTAFNHFGLKVPSLANALKKWRDAGYTVEREFKGSEGFPNAFLIGPDGLRFELQEDTTLKVPATAYHLHFTLPEPAKLRDWYVDTYGLDAEHGRQLPDRRRTGHAVDFCAVENRSHRGEHARHDSRSHRLRDSQPGGVSEEAGSEGNEAGDCVPGSAGDWPEHFAICTIQRVFISR